MKNTSGACGDNLTWTLEGGTLIISGEGAMADYVRSYAPWNAYSSQITSAVLENGVTSIGAFAFIRGYALKSVTIPDSVTKIAEGAFAACGLKSVTIPDSVTSIGEGAFGGCYALKSVTIPDSVTSIGYYAFAGCWALKI